MVIRHVCVAKFSADNSVGIYLCIRGVIEICTDKISQRFLPNDRERNDPRCRKNATRFVGDVLPSGSSFESFEIRTCCISSCDAMIML